MKKEKDSLSSWIGFNQQDNNIKNKQKLESLTNCTKRNVHIIDQVSMGLKKNANFVTSEQIYFFNNKIICEKNPISGDIFATTISSKKQTSSTLSKDLQIFNTNLKLNADVKKNLPQQQKNNVKLIRSARSSLFTRLKSNLVKIQHNLGDRLISLFHEKKIDDNLFRVIEEQLLVSDIGVETTHKIINRLTDHVDRYHLKNAEILYSKLREEMAVILSTIDQPLLLTNKMPFIILMVGVNGVGKTTTVGKLAYQYRTEGKSVILAAGDTFRAAAVEQLQIWGERNNISVIVGKHTNTDSASVIFDAIQVAKMRGIDVLIADTAGRLQNKTHLMEGLKKIIRVIKKLDIEAPHEIMLTIDVNTGQNALNQVNLFNNIIELTGIVLTKLDGTAKGGIIFSIADQFRIPIRYIGIGENIEDLQSFKAKDFIEAIFIR